MSIDWERKSIKGEYYLGKTASRFEAHIALSTNAGKYVWTICHSDFRFVVIGGEVASVEAGKKQAADWLIENAKG
jgi:hypothetical protein